jgi:hypothetical protein
MAKKWYHNYQQWDEESWIEDKSVSEVIEEGIKKLQKESAFLEEAVRLLSRFVPHKDTIQWELREIEARDFLIKLSKEGS